MREAVQRVLVLAAQLPNAKHVLVVDFCILGIGGACLRSSVSAASSRWKQQRLGQLLFTWQSHG